MADQIVKLSPLLHHWSLLFLPYQSFSYFRNIFDFFAELTLYRSVTAQRRVYLLYLLYAIFCLQNLYLWTFLPLPIDRLRHGDLLSLVFQIDSYYLALVALAIMMVYFIHVLSFTMKPAYLRLLEDTLFEDTTRTLSGVAYGRFTEQATVRIIVLVLVNLLHGFILFIDAVLLFLIYSLATTAIENPGELLGSPLDTPFTFIWNVIQIMIGTWITVTSLAFYSKVCINVATIGAGQLCVLFRRLYHSETLLAVYSRKDRIFSWAPFRQYLLYSGQTFGILFTANEINGRVFFAFLVVNMPISAWALDELALGELGKWPSIVLSCMPAHELICCILIHWTFAKFTKRLHRPSKTLLRLNASTGHRVGNFRARLLLHHTIVRLHTKAKYGFTYGSVGGLIMIGSFAKCMILYTEMLMYVYKFIRGI